MTKEEQDVKSEESQSSTTSSVEQKEQGTDNQGVETQDNQSTDIVSNYKKAMLEEREKRKKLQDQLSQVQSNQPQFEPQDYNQEDEEDIEDGKSKNELERLKAEQLITRKLVEDPSFKDRADIVRDYMEKNPGVGVDQADDAVLANFTRKALSNAQPAQPQPVPNQLNPSAVPETPTTQPKVSLDNVIEGKGSTGNPELDNTFRRFANGKPDDYSRVPNAVIRDPRKF